VLLVGEGLEGLGFLDGLVLVEGLGWTSVAWRGFRDFGEASELLEFLGWASEI
jgi:hypothetical protein